MNELPERIWACMGGPMVGMFVSGGNNGGWPEYIRADIVPHVKETPKSEHDAANMLTLTAERDRLREADKWRDAVRNRIDDLIKQRDLYAEALDAISVATPRDDPARVLSECVRIARVALGEKP